MMGIMMRAAWWNLRRDYVALALMFVLPIAFFSIFAAVFSNMGGGGGGMSDVEIAVVDEDHSDASRRMIDAMLDSGGLDVRLGPSDEPEARYDRAAAEQLVRSGAVYVAVIFPAGFGESFGDFTGDGAPIEMIADPIADPVSHQMVAGLLQGVAMQAAPDLLIEQGLGQFDKYVGMTEEQKTQITQWLDIVETEGLGEATGGGADGFNGMVAVKTIDISADTDDADEDASRKGRIVAFYAAAIGVMFLLFSMAGAMGALLEEERSGTLERLLNSNIGMGRLLLSYWFFAAAAGFLQVTAMFIWGWLVFGLEFWTLNHLSGFTVMTAVSAAAAAGFGLMLGTVCRSEGQLRGISTIVILVMSAVGGSMFPRFLMPDTMQAVGLATFNGWAIDGYQKVFHQNLPAWSLWPEALVLTGMTLAFLGVARLSARRWEAV